jgi:uncharacterized protein (DUF1778 family)
MTSDENRPERVEIRLEAAEKAAFQQCAELAGTTLSAWMRERLRRVARAELEDADRKVPFLKSRI